MRLAVAIALVLTLTQNDIERAQKIARSPEAEPARFHARYVFPIKDPTITTIEVITEFRRIVLITEDHLRRGDWLFSQSVPAAEEATRDTRGRLTVIAQLRFHPLNTYISVPPFQLAIGPASAGNALAPLETGATPQFASAVPRAGRASLVGATLRNDSLAADVGQAPRSVGVVLEGKELARIVIDFGALD